MHVVDASVWVSRLVSGDVHHEPSRLWLAGLVEEGTALTNTGAAAPRGHRDHSRRVGRPELAAQALSVLQCLPNMRFVPIEADLARLAGQFAADLALRGADAVYVSLAYQLGVPLATWDREQLERSPTSINVLTPQDLLAP